MAGQHWLTGEVLDEDTAPWILGINKSYFMLGLKSAGMFLLVFIILTINFLALSVSLQCNRGKPNKLASAIYAFFFGPIYLIVNYYSVRLMSKGESCEFSTTNPFPF